VKFLERIDEDLKKAMKARDTVRVDTLRMLKSDLKYKQIELGRELSEDDIIGVLSAAARKRSEAMEEYQRSGREDLREKEFVESEIIKEFLPQQISLEELHGLIEGAIAETGASSPKDLGDVMKVLMPRIRGRADGKQVNAAVRAKLLQ
jgi:uncharacterized protein YqeY